MKKSTLKKYSKKILTASILSAGFFSQTQAAPLPVGSVLGLDAGTGAATNIPCSAGSCFGMEISPGLIIWTNVGPGTDGGFVVGKNQASGGQELGPSAANSATGELTAAWNFFANFGTFFTPDGASNVFDDASCAGPACIGTTALNSFNVAWNGTNVPMGSANGCNSSACSPEELAGDYIIDYTYAGSGQPWGIHYHNVVPDGDPSSFGNVKFQFLARGAAFAFHCDIAKLTGEVYVEGQTGEFIPWIPKVEFISKFTCLISTPPTSGAATVASDCSTGDFIADQPGVYTFYYDAILRPESNCYIIQYSDPGMVTVTVSEPNPTPPADNNPPIAYDLTVFIPYALSVTWTPNVIDPDGDAIFCDVSQPPPDNYDTTVTIAPDCSSGTITSLVPIDSCHKTSFTYSAHDQYGAYSNQATVTVDIDKGCGYFEPTPTPTPSPTPTPTPTTCEGLYPQTEITMMGKGKNLEVENTMTTTFKGHIVSSDEGKGKVTICRGTTIGYEVASTVGTATCTVKHGVSAETTGTLTDKGKLVCTNKPDGKDTDRFKIKRAKNKDFDPSKASKGWHR